MNRQKELIPMRPGDLLRYHRDQAGMSVETAAALSKTRPSVIAAIESGETASIPSVYLRGYVRNYARALGLDQAEVEEQMQHVQGSDPGVQSIFTVPSRRGRTEKWLKASSYLAASAVIAALAWQFTHEAVRFSQGDSELSSRAAVPADQTGAVSEQKAAAERSPKTHLNASIASVEVLQRDGERGARAAEEAWAAIDGPSELPQGTPRIHELGVTTSADSWVEIVDGQGTRLELDLIRAGKHREYSGLMPFQVMVGRASAVDLTLDGEAVDLAPHTREDVARLILEEERPQDGSQPSEPGQR
jgi:cytoskeleton protein RodZ